jgi:hypothetical protein
MNKWEKKYSIQKRADGVVQVVENLPSKHEVLGVGAGGRNKPSLVCTYE